MSSDNTIWVPVNLDVKGMEKRLHNLERNLTGFGASASKTLNAIESNTGGVLLTWQKWSMVSVGLKNAISAINGAINSLFGGYASFTDLLSKTSQRTGMSTEALTGLKFAAEQSGSSFDEATDAVKTFHEQLGAAKLGDVGAIGKLGAVGIYVNDYEGLTKEDEFLKLADHIAAIQDPATQTRAAIELFGDAGYKLLPLFQEGKSGIEKLKSEAKDLGLIMGEDAIQGGVKLTDAINRIKTSTIGLTNCCAATLAPAISALMDKISGALTVVGKYMANHPTLIRNLAALATAVTAIGGAIAALKAVSLSLVLNPWVAIIAGAALYVAYLSGAFSDAEQSAEALAHRMKEQTTATDELVNADKRRLARLRELQGLSDNGMLNNAEISEAASLVDTLGSRYGDLGIVVDKVTGKISGMGAAQEKVLDKMREAQIMRRNAELAEAESNINILRQQRSDEATSGVSLLWDATQNVFVDKGMGNRRQERLKPIDDKISAEQNRRAVILAELEALKSGNDLESDSSGGDGESEGELEAASRKQRAADEQKKADAQKTIDTANTTIQRAKLSDRQKELADVEREIATYRDAYLLTHPETTDGAERFDSDYYDFMASREAQKQAINAKYKDQFKDPKPKFDAIKGLEGEIADRVSKGDYGSIDALRRDLEEAKKDLARSNVGTARKERDAAQEEFKQKDKRYQELDDDLFSSEKERLAAFTEREAARKRVEETQNAYNKAATVVADQNLEERQKTIDAAKSRFDSASSRGTFSAYEAGSVGNSTAIQQLNTMQKMLTELMHIKDNTGEGAGVITA